MSAIPAPPGPPDGAPTAVPEHDRDGDLRTRSHAYALFAALRRIETANPERPRLGRSTRAQDDPVRLGQAPALQFAPHDIHSFEPRDGAPPRLRTFHPGLFGPHGPLPLHLTEYAFERERHFNDPTFARFADMFHHRLLSLFYRAWADAQPTVQYERPDEDRFALYVGALFGGAGPALRGRDALPDGFKRHFAGRLLPAAKNAEGLRELVSGWFGVAVQVREFVPSTMPLPIESRTRLGETRETGTLGANAVLGASVPAGQSRFRLRLGPLRLAQFKHLLPGRESAAQLVALVRNYVGDEFAWDAQLVLKRREMPGTQLGRGAQLGWSSWLAPPATGGDADDLLLALGV